jgi:predicted PurR-regulated permease PerM
MGLFSRREPDRSPPLPAGRGGDANPVLANEPARAPIWKDQFGRWSIRSLQVLLILAISAVSIWLIVVLKLVFIPVLIAIILASAAAPLLSWLRSRGISSTFAAWITLLGGGAVIGGIITFIAVTVGNQWDTLADSASDGLDEFQAWLAGLPIPIDQEQVTALREGFADFLASIELGAGVVAGVSSVAEFVTGLLLMIVVLFYFLKDGDRIWDFLLKPFRGSTLARGHRIGVISVEVLGSYVRGTAIVGLVDATVIGLGLVILQVPLALPLAVIVFLGAFIPLVGATLAGAVAALVALVANGPVVAIIVIVLVIVVQELEGDLVQPLVMGKSLKLHPLVILLALTAGTIVAGIIGAVLAVPIAAVVWAIIRVWHGPDPTLQVRPPRRRRRKDAAAASEDGIPSAAAGSAAVA